MSFLLELATCLTNSCYQIPWLGLGVLGVSKSLRIFFIDLTFRRIQGVLGALLIKLNVQAAVYRRNSPLKDLPLFEVVVVTAITAIISWPVRQVVPYVRSSI